MQTVDATSAAAAAPTTTIRASIVGTVLCAKRRRLNVLATYEYRATKIAKTTRTQRRRNKTAERVAADGRNGRYKISK